jgi:hypothetical protein
MIYYRYAICNVKRIGKQLYLLMNRVELNRVELNRLKLIVVIECVD